MYTMEDVKRMEGYRRRLKDMICKLRWRGYDNYSIRETIETNHPFLWDLANTLHHYPVPVRMSRKEINEAKSQILADSEVRKGQR